MKLRTRRRLYLREAFIALLLARIAVRLIAPIHIFAWVDRPPKRTARFAGVEIDWVAWAIEAAAAKWPIDASCLPCALAVHAMLRRRGIASRICLAVARTGPVRPMPDQLAINAGCSAETASRMGVSNRPS